mgnify:FL=1
MAPTYWIIHLIRQMANGLKSLMEKSQSLNHFLDENKLKADR